jgi:hypothetical protein
MVICKICGADIPADSKYCPKCGQAVEGGAAQGPEGCDWRDRRSAERGGWGGRDWGSGSWWSEDWMKRWSWTWSPLWIMINMVVAGLFIVLLGTLFFLAASGFASLVTWDNLWAYLLVGVGVLGIIRETAKYYVSGRWFVPGVVPALVLIVLGLAGLAAGVTGWSNYWWAIVIAAGGLMIVLVGFFNYLWMKNRQRR